MSASCWVLMITSPVEVLNKRCSVFSSSGDTVGCSGVLMLNMSQTCALVAALNVVEAKEVNKSVGITRKCVNFITYCCCCCC